MDYEEAKLLPAALESGVRVHRTFLVQRWDLDVGFGDQVMMVKWAYASRRVPLPPRLQWDEWMAASEHEILYLTEVEIFFGGGPASLEK